MTVPNVLAGFRLLAAPLLVVLAWADHAPGFLALFLVLEATDWIDGKLAVWLDQRTTLGARLDTVADLVMYAGLLVGLVLLEGRVFLDEWPWMAPAVATYVVSWSASLVKFGQIPSYHPWSAKVSWFVALVAAVTLLTLDWVWPLRVAAVAVTVANIEAVALTLILDEARADVRSVLGVWPGSPGPS